MSENKITLYPSNWLYNASVLGFIDSVENVEKNINIKDIFKESGVIELELPFFKTLNVKKRYFDENKEERVSSIYRNARYRNFLTTEEEKDLFYYFVESLDNVVQSNSCDFCNRGYWLSDEIISEINARQTSDKKFLKRISNFNFVHNTDLGPAPLKFPNSYWNNKQGIKICHLCSFFEIHHHRVLTRLSDLSEIFINAPSFKVMYELNKFAKEAYGSKSVIEARTKREILATSVIEYTNKIKASLGIWTEMNIEIIQKYKVKNEKGKLEQRIDFFSIPSEVIRIISDKEISNLLSDIAEFRILNNVIDKKYSNLVDIGYKILREGTKDYNKRNEKLISSLLYQWKNQNNLSQTANKILKLYSLIEDKNKRS